jgi:two-component system phosphate regulon sensor histidine kinase PhoR
VKNASGSKLGQLPLFGEHDELALLQSAISDAVLAVDTNLEPYFYNSRLALLFELNAQGTNVSTGNKLSLAEMVTNEEVVEAFKEAIETGSTKSLTAAKFHLANGGRLYLSVSVAPMKRGKQITGAVGVFHDVTELKTAEQMRIDFVANVSHELRTPLTSIQGYVETLIHDQQVGQSINPDYLEVIHRNTHRLINLIDDLLDLSALDSNSAALHKEKIDTNEATKRVLAPLVPSFEAKNQKISFNCERAPLVFADPRRLEQVMINLIDNASKYTPNGGSIDIRWVENPDSPGVLLKISDTGPGIPAKHHTRLFERFYRIDKARSRDMGGTGLGLAIVKHIMQSHQGSVEVDSSPGKGTQFICAFPNPKNIPGLSS